MPHHVAHFRTADVLTSRVRVPSKAEANGAESLRMALNQHIGIPCRVEAALPRGLAASPCDLGPRARLILDLRLTGTAFQ